LIAFLAVAASFAFTVTLALAHAHMSSWIQGLNYVAAGIPLAMAAIQLARARSEAGGRARRLFGYYFLIAILIAVYAWYDVESHETLLKAREAEAEALLAEGDPAKLAAAGLEESDREVWFPHSLTRRHVLNRTTRQWRDEAAARERP
jgi:hypothetical protein